MKSIPNKKIAIFYKFKAEYEALKTVFGDLLCNNLKDFVIILSSGSTNNPKPIVLSQKTKILRSIETRKLYNINSTDVVLGTLPLYFLTKVLDKL